jgi:hypothetical protein
VLPAYSGTFFDSASGLWSYYDTNTNQWAWIGPGHQISNEDHRSDATGQMMTLSGLTPAESKGALADETQQRELAIADETRKITWLSKSIEKEEQNVSSSQTQLSKLKDRRIISEMKTAALVGAKKPHLIPGEVWSVLSKSSKKKMLQKRKRHLATVANEERCAQLERKNAHLSARCNMFERNWTSDPNQYCVECFATGPPV